MVKHRIGWLKQIARHSLTGTIVTLALAGMGARAEDNYPVRPVHMIIPFAAGGQPISSAALWRRRWATCSDGSSWWK